MTDLIPVDPNLKLLVESHSTALSALLAKIVAGEANITEDIARVSATMAELTSAVAEPPKASEPPSEPSV